MNLKAIALAAVAATFADTALAAALATVVDMFQLATHNDIPRNTDETNERRKSGAMQVQ